MGGKSKQKGSGFEREICVKLSKWLTNGQKEDVFWRSAMSGGRATVHHSRGTTLRRQSGDITAVAPEGHALTDRFYIEARFYKDLELSRLLVGKGTLATFWRETMIEAEKYDKNPLLIARQNRFPTLALVTPIRWFSNTNPIILSYRAAALVYLFDEILAAPYLEGDIHQKILLDNSII